jgi:tetratricopeptide (TPR) repeat protein
VTSTAVTDLLALAMSRPGDALRAARRVLANGPGPLEASVAAQAAGIVLRDRGDLTGAVAELRRALRFARAARDPDREADVRATLGYVLVWLGRPGDGLEELGRAARQARGGLAGRVLLRRAAALLSLGRYREARDDLNTALPLLRRAGDEIWLARVHTHRAQILLLSGAIARARAEYDQAETLFNKHDMGVESAGARHNRGFVAMAQGDLPQALRLLAEAGELYRRMGVDVPDLAIDRSRTLLAAGLAHEALVVADAGAEAIRARRGPAFKRAELLNAAAAAALAVPDSRLAIERARAAQRLFRAQDRPLWQVRSELVLAHARHAAGQDSPALLARTADLALRLTDLDAEEAQRAHLLAGRIALAIRREDDARRHLGAAARVRRGSPPLVRSVAALARALAAEADGDDRATLAACRAGLAALDEHRLRLGSTELRAHATGHGAELSAIAVRVRHRQRDARRLLRAAERWRATTITTGGDSAPGEASELATDLAALRAVARRIEEMRGEDGPTAELERERRRLERQIGERTRQRSRTGRGGVPPAELDLDALTEALGDTRLVELVEVEGRLQVLTVVGGRVRRRAAGPTPTRLVEQARFLLRRAAVAAPARQMPGLLDQVGHRLQEALLGPALADLDDAPVVVVPPGPLHALPWSLLPALRDRVLSVAPSAATLLRMHGLPRPARRRTVLVAGPRLTAGEIAELAARDRLPDQPEVRVLRDAEASAEPVLAALDGAWLAHVAAHGTFRSDNPLFSSLALYDGPLTVHDLERMTRAPYRLLLPSCDSGVAAPVGADELLGLVSSLVSLGSAGVLAGIVEINDRATAPLMVELHTRLEAGDGLAEALLAARRAHAGDPLATATGHSFIAFGI